MSTKQRQPRELLTSIQSQLVAEWRISETGPRAYQYSVYKAMMDVIHLMYKHKLVQ